MIDIRVSLRKISNELEKNENVKTIAFLSMNDGLGQTTLIANLAAMYSKKGSKVLVLDLDTKDDTFALAFDFSSEPGIYDYLESTVEDYRTFLKAVDSEKRLVIFPAGNQVANKSLDMLSSRKFSTAFAEMLDQFDYILVNLKPEVKLKEALVPLKMVDGLVLSIESERTSKRRLHKLLKNIEQNELPMLGYVDIKRI